MTAQQRLVPHVGSMYETEANAGRGGRRRKLARAIALAEEW